jgi:NADH-quinone oxidoreductase subunit H
MAFLQVIPSWAWFFLKLSVLLFTFIWIRGTLPRVRIDQVMKLAWTFMLPMAFACVLAAAAWHYSPNPAAGWVYSLVIVGVVYAALSRVLEARKNLSVRTYRFAE